MATRESYMASCSIYCNGSLPHELTVMYKNSEEEAKQALEDRIEAYRLTEGKVEVGGIKVMKMK